MIEESFQQILETHQQAITKIEGEIEALQQQLETIHKATEVVLSRHPERSAAASRFLENPKRARRGRPVENNARGYILYALDENPKGLLTAELVQEMLRLGWTTTSGEPTNNLGPILARLQKDGAITATKEGVRNRWFLGKKSLSTGGDN